MIPANQLTRDRVEQMNEADLRVQVLLPLFKAMGFQGVHETHGGSGEQGKDIVMWKLDELGERVNFGVVVLATRITGRAEGSGSTSAKVQFQVQQCLRSGYHNLLTLEDERMDRCWVVTSKTMKKEARESLSNTLGDLGRLVRFIDGDELWALIERYLKPFLLSGKMVDLHEGLGSASEHYHVIAGLGGPVVTLDLVPKYPGAEQDEPAEITPVFEFPETPEGREAKAAYEAHVKTGAPVHIPPQFVSEITMPDFLKPVLASLGSFGIMMGPNALDHVFFCDVVVEQVGTDAALLTGIELRVPQAGSEQITLTNAHQELPWKFSIVVDFVNKVFHLQSTYNLLGMNVKQQLEAAEFQRALARGGMIKFVRRADEQILVGGPIDTGVFPAPVDAVITCLRKLLLIQRRTGHLFSLPDSISSEEMEEIFSYAQIVEHGYLKGAGAVASLQIPAGRQLARNLLEYLGDPDRAFLINGLEPQTISLLGKEIELGKALVIATGLYLTPEDASRLREAFDSQDNDEAIFHLTVHASPLNEVVIHYERWLSDAERQRLQSLYDFP